MKKIVQIILIFSISIFFAACGANTQSVNLSTPKGYKAKTTLYSQKEKSKDYLFILLHGKAGNTQSSFRIEAYENLASKGYEVLVPQMPWSKEWEGTLAEGLELIESAIKYAVKKDKKPILVGHSLGGAVSLIYNSKNPHKNLAGTIIIAPGHLLHQSRKMREISQDSLSKANNMVKNGQGNKKANFTMLNTGKTKEYYMKAKVYQSYYNTSIFPDVRDLLENIEKPILWIAGKKDRLTRIYNMADMFELLGDNDKNEYVVIEGSHRSVLSNSTDKMISWSESLN